MQTSKTTLLRVHKLLQHSSKSGRPLRGPEGYLAQPRPEQGPGEAGSPDLSEALARALHAFKFSPAFELRLAWSDGARALLSARLCASTADVRVHASRGEEAQVRFERERRDLREKLRLQIPKSSGPENEDPLQ